MRIDTAEEGRTELAELLKENLKLSKAILHSVEKTRRHIFIGQIANWLRLLLLLVPIVLAALYLPPLIKKLQEGPAALFGNFSQSGKELPTLTPALIDELRRLLK